MTAQTYQSIFTLFLYTQCNYCALFTCCFGNLKVWNWLRKITNYFLSIPIWLEIIIIGTLLQFTVSTCDLHTMSHVCWHACMHACVCCVDICWRICCFLSECSCIGLPPLVIPAGTVGVVIGNESTKQMVAWSHQYTAWSLLAAMTTQLLHTPGVGVGECVGSLWVCWGSVSVLGVIECWGSVNVLGVCECVGSQ